MLIKYTCFEDFIFQFNILDNSSVIVLNFSFELKEIPFKSHFSTKMMRMKLNRKELAVG